MRFLPLLLLLFLLLTTAPTVRAQKLPVAIPDPVRYGQVTATDLDPTHFAADTGAAAVVLADYGRTSIVDGSINDSE